MDKLDIMILRELIDVPAASPAQTDIRKSLRKVAEKLGFSESAVRERVTRFRESGLLKGWIPFFNPSLFGLRVSGIWFDVNASSKEALLKKLQLMHGVMGIVNFFGSRVAMLVVYETTGAFRRELELIQRISETENLIQSELRMPPSKVKLSPTDYRILLSLLTTSQRSYKEIAVGLGLSSRTIKRRIERLTESQALFAAPSFDPSKLEGSIMANLLVTYENPESKLKVDSAIRSQFGDMLIGTQRGFVDREAFLFCIGNISKSREIVSWTLEQRGVREGRIDILEKVNQRFDWFKELIKSRLAVPLPPQRQRKRSVGVPR